jgi:mitochondrial fission protein ELM1
MSPGRAPRIWGLLGHRVGDNNQVLALCEELGLPFTTLTLRYNLLRALEGRHLGATLATLTRASRRWVEPPWPDLVIAIGRRSVGVARYIRKQSGGRTRLVLIGHPRVDPRDFDLVITTPQYPVPRHDNVMLLTLTMARRRVALAPTAREAEWLGAIPRPHLLFAIGGPTKYYDLPAASMADAASRLADRAVQQGGSLIVVGSPRSDRTTLDDIAARLDGSRHRLVTGRQPRFPVLLDDADEIFVTADSMSMLSEAILAGVPVGMVPVELNETGRRWLGDGTGSGTKPGTRRDLSKVWTRLEADGLIGTIENPRSGAAENPVREAADRVRLLLGDLV